MTKPLELNTQTTNHQLVANKEPPSLKDQVIGSALMLLINNPDVLSFAVAGACLAGWPGAAIGALTAGFIRTQIVPQDLLDPGTAISNNGMLSNCGLKNCKHC